MLNVMMEMVPEFPDYQFVIAGAPSVDLSFYEKFIKGSQIAIVQNQTYQLLQHAQAALVTSGTATLETALFGVPEVVCYKGNRISYEIAKRIVKVKYISLVNLIMDREVVTELIQNEMNTARLQHELSTILFDGDRKKQLALDYKALWQKLGGPGASAKAAGIVVGDLQ